MSRNFRPVSVTLSDREKQKLAQLARMSSTNRSDTIRQMIRMKRLPRDTGKQNRHQQRQAILVEE